MLFFYFFFFLFLLLCSSLHQCSHLFLLLVLVAPILSLVIRFYSDCIFVSFLFCFFFFVFFFHQEEILVCVCVSVCSFQANLFGFILVTNVDMIYLLCIWYVCISVIKLCVIHSAYILVKNVHIGNWFLQNLTLWIHERERKYEKIASKFWLSEDFCTHPWWNNVRFAKHITIGYPIKLIPRHR